MKKKRNLSLVNLILFLIVLVLIAVIVFLLFIGNQKEIIDKSSEDSKSELTEDSQTESSEEPQDSETTVTSEEEEYLINNYNSDNCTTAYLELMLINKNYEVSLDFIEQRKSELVDITELYGIKEAGGNGIPYLDEEAASHLNEMISDYREAYEGHDLQTLSCFRSVGTSCGRMCAATQTSDHHSGYTCDLVDPSYGTRLNTDLLPDHPEWSWLAENSYKYGFILRFPENWAGGSMDEPLNVDESGTTGYYETWHFRYVGIDAAWEIATGKYNNGEYDSLEHYLLETDKVTDLLNKQGACPLVKD